MYGGNVSVNNLILTAENNIVTGFNHISVWINFQIIHHKYAISGVKMIF